jgi:hypothetical protein
MRIKRVGTMGSKAQVIAKPRKMMIRDIIACEDEEVLSQYLELNKDEPWVRSQVHLVKAAKTHGISEFIDPESEILKEVNMLDRVIFFNRTRKEILENMFYYDSVNNNNYGINAFFDLNLFTEKEKQFVIFRMNDLNTKKTIQELKLFVHNNFKDIRSVENIRELLEDDDDQI